MENGLTVSVLRMPENVRQWNLVSDYMRLRKAVFFDQMAWPLYVHDGLEYEQYDSLHAVYVIAHEAGQVIGGARLLPTSHQMGNGRLTYSYMIRDACRGLLPGLPSDLCEVPPLVNGGTWELTRLVANGRPNVGVAILDAANRWLREAGGKECLFLAPLRLRRMAELLGYAPRMLGPILQNTEGKFHVFSCAVR
jgi:acyl homoserine lactone synthase